MKKAVFLAIAVFFVTAICFAQAPSNTAVQQPAAQSKGDPSKVECPYAKEKVMGGMNGMMGERDMGMMSGMMGHGMMGGMKGHGMMGGSMMDMKSKMCSCNGASMIAGEKGGVIVLFGDDLYKFDKDLNLVKKVELGEEHGCGFPPGHPDIGK
jgi:hypothetical protein